MMEEIPFYDLNLGGRLILSSHIVIIHKHAQTQIIHQNTSSKMLKLSLKFLFFLLPSSFAKNENIG